MPQVAQFLRTFGPCKSPVWVRYVSAHVAGLRLSLEALITNESFFPWRIFRSEIYPLMTDYLAACSLHRCQIDRKRGTPTCGPTLILSAETPDDGPSVCQHRVKIIRSASSPGEP